MLPVQEKSSTRPNCIERLRPSLPVLSRTHHVRQSLSGSGRPFIPRLNPGLAAPLASCAPDASEAPSGRRLAECTRTFYSAVLAASACPETSPRSKRRRVPRPVAMFPTALHSRRALVWLDRGRSVRRAPTLGIPGERGRGCPHSRCFMACSHAWAQAGTTVRPVSGMKRAGETDRGDYQSSYR
jgi:hypothetical protein